MNVAIVIQNEFSNVGEVRPRRLARSLSQKGHRVHILSRNSKKESCRQETPSVTINRFCYLITTPFYKVIGAPAPFNFFWLVWIINVIRKEEIDILVSSNIKVALPTIIAARLMGKPVVLDLQEHNEALVRLRPKTRLIHYISRNPFLVKYLERLCIWMANGVWLVVEERLSDLPISLRNKGKIRIVKHTASLSEIRPSVKRARQKNASDFVLIYIGKFSGGFDSIELALKALAIAIRSDPYIRFVIGGVDVQKEGLIRIIRALGIHKHVEIYDTIHPDAVPDWLTLGDLGILLYPVDPSTSLTISNKVFHYMAAGLPIISSDMSPTRRVIEEVQCGKIVPLGSTPKEVADMILEMKRNLEELKTMSENGIRAVLEKYNWDFDFRTALHHLRCLVHEEADEQI